MESEPQAAHGQNADIATAKRLQEILEFFETHNDTKKYPEYQHRINYENEALPSIVGAENERNLGLNLHIVKTCDELNQLITASQADRMRVIMHQPTDIPYNNHIVAVDIKKQAQKSSLIVLDSMGSGKESKNAAEIFNKELAVSSTVLYITTNQEMAWTGCHIFAVSFALKMQDHRQLFDRIHDDQLNRVDAERVTAINGPGLTKDLVLPPSFYKHAQSSRTIGECIKPNRKAPVVNKKGQTLLERYEAHKRYIGDAAGESHVVHSISLEEKRLVFLRRAIQYHKQRGNDVCVVADQSSTLAEERRRELASREFAHGRGCHCVVM
jgi:YopJ family protease